MFSTRGVIPTYGGVHQNEDSSQPSTPSSTFVSIVHTFYGDWWQRGRDCDKDMKMDELDMVDMDQ